MKSSPFEGFDPLAQSDHWEDRTRELVLARIEQVPPRRFFTEDEAQLLDAVVDRLLPQPDRNADDAVPVTPFIDQMLFEDDTDGFRKDGMPWDQQVWRLALRGFEETSAARYGIGFTELRNEQRDDVLAAVQAGEAEGQTWREIPAAATFDKVMQELVGVYYAHPAAWAEIGWPGPASKRGYMRTGYGERDPWQPKESAPASSVPMVRDRRAGTGPSGSGGGLH